MAARLKSMPTSPLSAVIQHLTADVAPGAGGMTDGELLAQFLSSRDDNAFGAAARPDGLGRLSPSPQPP
jgi:hypothetical protein